MLIAPHSSTASSSSRKSLDDMSSFLHQRETKARFFRTETQNQNLQIFQNMLYAERRAIANLTVMNKPDGFEKNQAEEFPNTVGDVGKAGVYRND